MDCRHEISPSDSPLLEASCEGCGFFGWSPGNGLIYPIPKLDGNRLIHGGQNDSEFLREVLRFPPRTRLKQLCELWGIRAHQHKSKLKELNNYLEEFGLAAYQLRTGNEFVGQSDIVSDEPLLISPIGYSPSIKSIGRAEPDVLFQKPIGLDVGMDAVLEDVERLKVAYQNQDLIRGRQSTGFRDKQVDAILCAIENPSSLSIFALPTGFGKTRIVESITWLLRRQEKGPTLMISPLISLMDDQRKQFETFSKTLESKIGMNLQGNTGFESAFLTAAEERNELKLMGMLNQGNIDLLCCSPEKLMDKSSEVPIPWIELLCSMPNKVSTLIIDEAHMVGDWGASIRPEFQMLSWVKKRLHAANPNLRVILMSATISRDEEDELVELFSDEHTKENLPIRETQTRKDLYFHIQRHESTEDEAETLVNLLWHERMRIPLEWYGDDTDVSGDYRPPLILYTPKKTDAKNLFLPLVKEKFGDARTYTGDTSADRRENIRLEFVEDRFPCLIGTSAFGMGIDKPNVWTTAYLGMPFTLKGLYQAFGRAARRSNWKSSEKPWRSGVCFASIPKEWPRSYKSPLGMPKMMERMYDMFLHPETRILENGYIIIPIRRGLESTHWMPQSNQIELATEDEEDIDDDTDIWKESVLSPEEDMFKVMSRLKRLKTLYKDRMWVLSCLQRTGRIEFMGVHASVLVENQRENKSIHLEETLHQRGYSGVINALSSSNPGWTKPDLKPDYAVIKLLDDINGWLDLCQVAIDGYNVLKSRHSNGRQELIRFLKFVEEGNCIRKLFGPTIGMEGDQEKTCSELLGNGDYCMPCSNCKGKIINATDKFLWSTNLFLTEIGAKNLTPPELKDFEIITLAENLERKRTNLSCYPMIKNETKIPIIGLELEGLTDGSVEIVNSEGVSFTLNVLNSKICSCPKFSDVYWNNGWSYILINIEKRRIRVE